MRRRPEGLRLDLHARSILAEPSTPKRPVSRPRPVLLLSQGSLPCLVLTRVTPWCRRGRVPAVALLPEDNSARRSSPSRTFLRGSPPASTCRCPLPRTRSETESASECGFQTALSFRPRSVSLPRRLAPRASHPRTDAADLPRTAPRHRASSMVEPHAPGLLHPGTTPGVHRISHRTASAVDSGDDRFLLHCWTSLLGRCLADRVPRASLETRGLSVCPAAAAPVLPARRRTARPPRRCPRPELLPAMLNTPRRFSSPTARHCVTAAAAPLTLPPVACTSCKQDERAPLPHPFPRPPGQSSSGSVSVPPGWHRVPSMSAATVIRRVRCSLGHAPVAGTALWDGSLGRGRLRGVLPSTSLLRRLPFPGDRRPFLPGLLRSLHPRAPTGCER
jgi:hypothetical protein